MCADQSEHQERLENFRSLEAPFPVGDVTYYSATATAHALVHSTTVASDIMMLSLAALIQIISTHHRNPYTSKHEIGPGCFEEFTNHLYPRNFSSDIKILSNFEKKIMLFKSNKFNFLPKFKHFDGFRIFFTKVRISSIKLVQIFKILENSLIIPLFEINRF